MATQNLYKVLWQFIGVDKPYIPESEFEVWRSDDNLKLQVSFNKSASKGQREALCKKAREAAEARELHFLAFTSVSGIRGFRVRKSPQGEQHPHQSEQTQEKKQNDLPEDIPNPAVETKARYYGQHKRFVGTARSEVFESLHHWLQEALEKYGERFSWEQPKNDNGVFVARWRLADE